MDAFFTGALIGLIAAILEEYLNCLRYKHERKEHQKFVDCLRSGMSEEEKKIFDCRAMLSHETKQER